MKSLERGVINEEQASEMEALLISSSKSIRLMCFDMAILIMMTASIMIIWQISSSSHLVSSSTIGAFLVFVRLAIYKLPPAILSLRIVMNVASGLFLLELVALALPEFIKVDDIEFFVFSSGVFASALLGLKKNDHILVKIFLITSLILFVSSGLGVVNSISGTTNILIVSSCVSLIALRPRESELTVAAQLVGSIFWLLSFTVFMFSEIDSSVIKIINWSLVVVAGCTLKLEIFHIPDRVCNALVAWGSLLLTGTLITFAIDKIGAGVPFAVGLILLSVIAMILVTKHKPFKIND